MKLVKCMFAGHYDQKKSPFGILNDQIRLDNIIKNAGWFSFSGERLGVGDLSLKDLQTISVGLSEEDIFIAISEADTKWNIPSFLNVAHPGTDYIVQNAVWVIAKGVIFRVRDDIDEKSTVKDAALSYTRIPRKELYKACSYEPKKIVDPGAGKIDASLPKAPPKAILKSKTPVKSAGITATKATVISNGFGLLPKKSNSPIPIAKPTVKKSTIKP